MLPMPGAPSASWAMYRARLAAAFEGVDPRVVVSFWLFGLINNVLYVIILSAALDLVGPNVPKSLVLLFDVVPSFLTKLIAPYFIQSIPYSVRIILLSLLSAVGMLLIALTPSYTDGGTIRTKMAGVVLSSLSSGGGELSFLGLTHYYGPFSLAAWGSGTGAAGLVGAGAYAIATTELKLPVQTTLLASACLPVIMVLSFFAILPREPLRVQEYGRIGQETVHEPPVAVVAEDDVDEVGVPDHEQEGLLAPLKAHEAGSPSQPMWLRMFKSNLKRSQKLFIPYMVPLLLVYIAEYTINQGVTPVLLFPLPSTPFAHFRAFYPAYAAIYQAGVFISRSSTPFIRIHHLYLPSLLQVLNLFLLGLHAMYNFIPNVYIVFGIIFWEGLLGGLVYVSTFAEILDNVPRAEREFSLSATSVSDSGGVCIAGFLGLVLEGALCNYQVTHGRDYCKQT